MAHIMIVDDDREITNLVAKLLTKAGHRVTASDSGEETLRLLGLEPDDPFAALPDLILLDIMIPELDGHTLGAMIRKHERTRHIPIVFVSALQQTSPIFEAPVKVEGYLTKPFAPEDLRAIIAKLLPVKAPPPPKS